MNRGGISARIVGFAQAMVGHFRGGLAQVNVVDSMLFAGISGSAVADVSALGSIIIPQMEKKGYPKPFAAAITAASAIIGPIIPPSGIMIIYAYVMGESVAALFLAGIVPGILIGVALMITIKLMANRYNLPDALPRASWVDVGKAAGAAFWPLMTPVLLMGGILSGVFTPTEAAAVAVGYSFVISIFILKTLTWRDIPGVLTRAGITSSVVMLLVGAAMAFKTVAALAHTPELLASTLLSITENPLLLLLLVNLLLFIVGMFLDAGPAIIILGPILGPIFASLGVDPVHFAIVMVVNLTVGLLTPPMGLVLFATSAVSGLRVETIARAVMPFLLVEFAVILLITFVPAIPLTLPRLLGFVD